jgi:protein phosphatase
VEEMSIGEFARRSRLSPKALRLYDGRGLLSPARVDELSGYRYYEDAKLHQARLIATLRPRGVRRPRTRRSDRRGPVAARRRGPPQLA